MSLDPDYLLRKAVFLGFFRVVGSFADTSFFGWRKGKLHTRYTSATVVDFFPEPFLIARHSGVYHF
jgi:hypothetical protein